MATDAIAQFRDSVDPLVQDTTKKLSDLDRNRLIGKAIVQRYSKDRPQHLVEDIAGDGSAVTAMPASYEDNFSVIESIEFPIGNDPATLLEDDAWSRYRTPAGLKLRFASALPTVTEKVRVQYTARHAKDGSTVPAEDFDAVCDLAASLCLDALAAQYAQTGDSTIGADVVNYRTKSSEYMGLAKAARKRYFDHVGAQDDSTGTSQGSGEPAAIAIGDMNEKMGWGGNRMTHGEPR
jgi:hypothetical protein